MSKIMPKMLLVDDDDVFIEILERAIVRSGMPCEYDIAPSLADAFAKLEKVDFDCILLDHKLGDGDAFELLEILTDVANPPSVIMLTNSEDVEIAVQAMKKGVFDFICKRNLCHEKISETIKSGLKARSVALQAERDRDALQRMSFYDELTGLANRNLLSDRLEQAIKSAQRNGETFTYFMMDLNSFKDINDSYGHDAGDEVLREAAQRLRSCLRDTDTVGRLGGDEFVAILEGTRSLDGAVVGAKKILDELRKPMNVGGILMEVGVSIGIALYPRHGRDSGALMKAADVAMYQAKKGEEYFSVATGSVTTTNRPERIASALQSEKLLEQIELHYQPKIEFDSPTVSGFEALARWRHPEFGQISPREFIPALERTNAIKQVTLHTISCAFLQQKLWCDAGIGTPIALNVSKRMLTEPSFPQQIEQLLAAYGIPAELFHFEFSEIATLKNQGLAIQTTWELANMGIQVSIGDFGSGQTSFQYLRDLPVNEIKLERSFIVDLCDEKLNRSIIRSVSVFAEGVGCDVVAVGVESAEVWEQLIALGCKKGQGYFFAPPMPTNELELWLRDWNRQVAKVQWQNAILPAVRQI